MFSLLNQNCNFKKMGYQKVRKVVAEARKHLNLAISLAERQLRKGRHFLFEHSLTARSWMEPAMKKLMRNRKVTAVECDQCMYGCTAMDSDGEYLPARKSTRFLTTSQGMALRLHHKCYRSHSHVPLRGKNPSEASFYPVELRLSILRGMRDQADSDANDKMDVDSEINVAELKASKFSDDAVMSVATICAEVPRRKEEQPKVAKLKLKDGSTRIVDLAKCLKPRYMDEYTREELPLSRVAEAIADELSWLNEKVWEEVPKEQVQLEDDDIIVLNLSDTFY